MQRSEWNFDNTADHDETDAPEPKSPEALVDQFGIRTALLVLCIASFMAAIWLEPISKSPEEDNEASELDEAEEVLGVILPPDEDTALPLYPREEALDEPAPHVTA